MEVIQKGEFWKDEYTQRPINVIQICSGIADLMEKYTVVSTMSVALVFIRMLQYFTFS